MMKIIENKKLFGVINLIDILLIVIVIVVGGVAYKMLFTSDTTVNIGAKYFTTTCVMKVENLPTGASNYLEIGADVYDNETNTYVGKLLDYSVGEYKTVTTNRVTNEFVQAVVPGKETVYLMVEVNVTDQGPDLVTANNYYIKVGKYISIRSNNFAGSGYVTKIDREG